MLRWSRLEWPDNAPRNIGDLAARVAMPLSAQLEGLCRADYGPDAAPFDGEALAKSLRNVSVLREDAEVMATDGLPPLLPAGVVRN